MTPKQRAEEAALEIWELCCMGVATQDNCSAIIERALAAQQAEHEAEREVAQNHVSAVDKENFNFKTRLWNLETRLDSERAAAAAEALGRAMMICMAFKASYLKCDTAPNIADFDGCIEAIRALKPRTDLVCMPRDEVERLRKDAQRLDFLEHWHILVYTNWTNSAMGSDLPTTFDGWATEACYGPEGPTLFRTIRDAIDGAIAEANKEGK